MFHKQIDELKVYSFFLFRNDCFEFMETTSEFGNTSKAGLEFSRDENKLGVCSLYQPDFIKAKRYIHKLMNKVPENVDLRNAPNILRKLRKFDPPKIRLWDETVPVSERVDCSLDKLKQIRNFCKVITPEGTTLKGNVKVFAKQKNCPKCGHEKTFKFQGELNRHVKVFHQELAREYVPRSWRGNEDAYIEQRLSCTYPGCPKGANKIFESTSALNKHK